MSRFLIAMFVGATIAAAASTSASAWHCLASSPNGAAGAAFGVILERARQSQCADASTAAVGLVAKSHGAGRTKIFRREWPGMNGLDTWKEEIGAAFYCRALSAKAES